MKSFNILLLLLIIIFSQFTLNTDNPNTTIWRYPILKMDTTTNTYFGQAIKDPYQYLENMNSSLDDPWIKEENLLYQNAFNKISNRDSLQKEITNFYGTTNIWTDIPIVAGEKLFFRYIYHKGGIHKISYRKGLDQEEIELFSTEKLSKKGTSYRIDYFQPSIDGDYVAFGISLNGSEQSIMYIIDVKKRELLPEKIERTMNGTPNWISDGSGFFYTQYKELLTKEDSLSRYEGSTIKFHKIGDAPSMDRAIFSTNMYPNLPIATNEFIHLFTFPSSENVLLAAMNGKQSALFYAPLKDLLDIKKTKIDWLDVSLPGEKIQAFALKGDDIFLLKVVDSGNGIIEKRILKDSTKTQKLIDGNKLGILLEDMILSQKALFVKTINNGFYELIQINLNDFEVKKIDLPFKGNISISTNFIIPPMYSSSTNLFLSLSSWNKEMAIYKYNLLSKTLVKTNLQQQGVYNNLSNIIFKTIEISSHDKTKVPLTLIYDKRLKCNKKNPTILYAYGANGIVTAPNLDKSMLAWLNRGGIYAIAHVRGGGEKGEAWHKGGYKVTKSNSWKDFIACAEYLIKHKYTSSDHLGASGGSAGGITIGRAVIERPSLFKAAVISAGALNPVRIEKGFNKVGLNEYGSSKDSIEFKYLLQMDVYHHIKKGINYPALLFTAGTNDPRLPIWQITKAVAKFQAASDGLKPILLRVKNGGHYDDIRDIANKYAFFLWQLGHHDFQYIPDDKN